MLSLLFRAISFKIHVSLRCWFARLPLPVTVNLWICILKPLGLNSKMQRRSGFDHPALRAVLRSSSVFDLWLFRITLEDRSDRHGLIDRLRCMVIPVRHPYFLAPCAIRRSGWCCTIRAPMRHRTAHSSTPSRPRPNGAAARSRATPR